MKDTKMGTFSLDASVYKELESFSALSGMSKTRIVERAIIEYVRRYNSTMKIFSSDDIVKM